MKGIVVTPIVTVAVLLFAPVTVKPHNPAAVAVTVNGPAPEVGETVATVVDPLVQFAGLKVYGPAMPIWLPLRLWVWPTCVNSNCAFAPGVSEVHAWAGAFVCPAAVSRGAEAQTLAPAVPLPE